MHSPCDFVFVLLFIYHEKKNSTKACHANPVLGGRVLGGTQVAPQDWPSMVRLVYRGGQRAVCSGVLVDPDTVLAVAHCVNG